MASLLDQRVTGVPNPFNVALEKSQTDKSTQAANERNAFNMIFGAFQGMTGEDQAELSREAMSNPGFMEFLERQGIPKGFGPAVFRPFNPTTEESIRDKIFLKRATTPASMQLKFLQQGDEQVLRSFDPQSNRLLPVQGSEGLAPIPRSSFEDTIAHIFAGGGPRPRHPQGGVPPPPAPSPPQSTRKDQIPGTRNERINGNAKPGKNTPKARKQEPQIKLGDEQDFNGKTGVIVSFSPAGEPLYVNIESLTDEELKELKSGKIPKSILSELTGGTR